LIGEFYRVIFITHSPLNQKKFRLDHRPNTPLASHFLSIFALLNLRACASIVAGYFVFDPLFSFTLSLFLPTVLYLPLASVAFCRTQPPALVPSVKLVSVLIFPKKKKKKSQKKERPKKGSIKKESEPDTPRKHPARAGLFPWPRASLCCSIQAKKNKKK
jgi:hypothetical protein